METKVIRNPGDMGCRVVTEICDVEVRMINHSRELFTRIIEEVAKRFVEENYQELVKIMDMQAVANMAVAAAGAKINETLNKKMTDKILEVEKVRYEREVYQRGILGGLKKI